MKIKLPTEQQKEELFHIHELCFRDHIEEIWGWDEKWQRDHFSKEWDDSEWRVLLDNDQIIGYLCWSYERDHLYLKNISFIPEFQNRGLGSQAMDFINKQADNKDLAIKLSVFRTNQRVISFYEKLGFKIYDTVETGYRMSKEFTELVSPMSEQDWDSYHLVREQLLYINRGLIGTYQRDHPDEFLDDNHPKIYKLDGQVIGVLRVDITDQEAGFRLVAITEKFQRGGYGTMMMRAAEQFALTHLDTTKKTCFSLNAARDAILFYEKLGYVVDDPKNWVQKKSPRMIRYVYP